MSRRCRLLKALAKSNLAMTWPAGMDCNYLRAQCTAVSHPPGVPTPSCRGLKLDLKRSTPKKFAHLDASRRNVNPTAMGRMPPDFFSRAISRPPKKWGQLPRGMQWPYRTMLTKPVSAVDNSGPLSWQFIMSLRCCGRSPSGPAEEPAGNNMIALRTSGSPTDKPESDCGTSSSSLLLLLLFYYKIVHVVQNNEKKLLLLLLLCSAQGISDTEGEEKIS